jgi:hypothetical protein
MECQCGRHTESQIHHEDGTDEPICAICVADKIESTKNKGDPMKRINGLPMAFAQGVGCSVQ